MREIIEGFGNLPNNYSNLQQCINVIQNSCDIITAEINDGYLDDEDDRFKFMEQALTRASNYLETLKNN